jgi:hypothetical protein
MFQFDESAAWTNPTGLICFTILSLMLVVLGGLTSRVELCRHRFCVTCTPKRRFPHNIYLQGQRWLIMREEVYRQLLDWPVPVTPAEIQGILEQYCERGKPIDARLLVAAWSKRCMEER